MTESKGNTTSYGGGPAFPNTTEDGMSLRDYFAGQAARRSAEVVCDLLTDGKGDEALVEAERHALAAYLIADALLAERAK